MAQSRNAQDRSRWAILAICSALGILGILLLDFPDWSGNEEQAASASVPRDVHRTSDQVAASETLHAQGPIGRSVGSGTLWNEVHVRSREGESASGAAWRCYSTLTGDVLQKGTTDQEGIARVSVESREVVFVSAEWRSRRGTYSGGMEIELGEGMPRRDLVISRDLVTIGVLVLEQGKPAPNVSVLVSDGQTARDDRTDERGLATFTGVLPGKAHVLLIDDFGDVIRKKVIPTSAGDSQLLVLHLPTGGLRVQLTRDSRIDHPVEGTIVAVQPIPNIPNHMDRLIRVDERGNGFCNSLLPGEYLVSVGHRIREPRLPSRQLPAWAPVFAMVEVTDEIEEVRLELVPCSVLRVKVLRPGTEAPTPATVLYEVPGMGLVHDWRNSPTYLTVSEFEEFEVPPGEIHVFAFNSVSGWGRQTVHLLPGETKECVIRLGEPGPRLTVEIFGIESGANIAVQVHAENGGVIKCWQGGVRSASLSSVGGSRKSEQSVEHESGARPDKVYSLPSLPPGVYKVSCSNAGELVEMQSVNLTRDTRVRVYLD